MKNLKRFFTLFLIFTIIFSIYNFSRAENITEENIDLLGIDASINDLISGRIAEDDIIKMVEDDIEKDGNYFDATKEPITLTSDIDGDVFIVCGDKATISSNINGNVFICAREVEITENAKISSSLFCAAQSIKIDGTVNLNAFCATQDFVLSDASRINLNLFLTGENINLSGTINRSANISGQNIEVSNSCYVARNLNYSAPNEINIPEGVVNGNTRFSSQAVNVNVITQKDKIVSFIKSTISYLVFAIIIFLIFNWLKAKLPNEVNDLKSNIVKYLLFGLFGLFVIPILSVILLFIPFMARVALTLMALYMAILIIASAITVVTLSKVFANKIKDTIKTNDILRTIICICIITIAYRLLKLVPVVGFITNFTAIVTGIGISIKSILPNDKDKIE